MLFEFKKYILNELSSTNLPETKLKLFANRFAKEVSENIIIKVSENQISVKFPNYQKIAYELTEDINDDTKNIIEAATGFGFLIEIGVCLALSEKQINLDKSCDGNQKISYDKFRNFRF